MMDRDQLRSASQLIQVEVGQAATVSWVNIGSAVTMDSEASAEWVCQAEGGYPAPDLTVTGPGGIHEGRQVRKNISCFGITRINQLLA